MAKKPKTIQLPEDVLRLAEAYESGSGIRFNRQVLAALLRFYFAPPDEGTPNAWMQLAVAVEKGKLPLSDVPVEARKEAVKLAQIRLGLDMPDPEEDDAKRALQTSRAALTIAEKDLDDWRHYVEHYSIEGDDPLLHLLQYLRDGQLL